ncbi:hypothetical protein [Phormidium sp. CCY1219]|nr:hypothetical protein [Phormidium sp. CCY1219]
MPILKTFALGDRSLTSCRKLNCDRLRQRDRSLSTPPPSIASSVP